MSLIKAKQIDLDDLAVVFANFIAGDPTYLSLWINMLNSTYSTVVYSNDLSNLTQGQTNLLFSHATEPVELFVYRNGSKLVDGTDYTWSWSSGTTTVILTEAIGESTGALFSEVIEINYF